MFINDLPTVLNLVLSLLFADDLKIFKAISSEEDMTVLQSNIDKVVDWSKRNSLPINDSKCELMIFCSRKSRYEDVHYFVGDTRLSPKKEVKDLGVIFDSHLSFNNNICSIVTDANRMLGFVIRSCRLFRHLNTMILLYNAFVRPKLEYACTVWHGHTQSQIEDIEKVQRVVRFHFICEFQSWVIAIKRVNHMI